LTADDESGLPSSEAIGAPAEETWARLVARQSVPAEVLAFFAARHSQSLLLRGVSGAGKTTFALTALRDYDGRRVFVSARAARARVEELFPWLLRDGEDIEIYDSIESGASDLHRMRAAFPTAGGPGGPPEGAEPPAEIDPLAFLPASLQPLWRSLEDGRRTLLVIDSWDGLLDAYIGAWATVDRDRVGRTEFERTLLRRLMRDNVDLVLVAEREAESQLDYLVDGILVLTVPQVDGRAERWMQIRKLRGVRIQDTDYPFTLEKARFETLRPFPTTLADHAIRSEADPGPAEGTLWPGSTAFAEAFGRLPLGQLSLVEIEPGVPTEGVRLFLFPMIDSIASEGGRVLLSMPPTMSVRQLWDLFELGFPEKKRLESIRILVTGRPTDTPEEIRAGFLTLPDAASHEVLLPQTIDFLRERNARDKGNAAFHWHRALKLLAQGAGIEYTPETAPRIAQQYLASGACHLMVFGQNGDPIFRILADMATLYLKFQDRRGRVLVSGVRPRTPAYLLSYADDPAPYRLMRVV
jgi:hypothetical protein